MPDFEQEVAYWKAEAARCHTDNQRLRCLIDELEKTLRAAGNSALDAAQKARAERVLSQSN